MDATHVYAEITDELRAGYAFADWVRLANASDEQRRDFYLSYYGSGLSGFTWLVKLELIKNKA